MFDCVTMMNEMTERMKFLSKNNKELRQLLFKTRNDSNMGVFYEDSFREKEVMEKVEKMKELVGKQTNPQPKKQYRKLEIHLEKTHLYIENQEREDSPQDKLTYKPAFQDKF